MDFANCPEGHELHCLAYEYARESAAMREDYKNVTSGRFRYSEVFPLYDALPWNDNVVCINMPEEFPRIAGIGITFVELPTGFPDRPFISLGYQPRQKYRRAVALEPISPMRVDRWTKACKFVGLPDDPAWAPFWHVCFKINYQETNEEIINAFSQWLTKEKQAAFHTDRKGISPARQAMALLKKLGALRLLRHLSVSEAMNVSKKPLFTKKSDWNAARKATELLLGRIEP